MIFIDLSVMEPRSLAPDLTLSVSQIAWHPFEEDTVAQLLAEIGVDFVELAPPRVFADTSRPQLAEALNCIDYWNRYGISPIAFQSLLFGHPGLRIFSTSEERASAREFLERLIHVAADMGIRTLVFGSPKNRIVPTNMGRAEAETIAADFFGQLGELASELGTTVCIEPNPKQYDCNFITTAQEGRDFVNFVDSDGFKLHLDIAGMWLSGESVSSSISQCRDVLEHFHMSAPELGPVERNGLPYAEAFESLRSTSYAKAISIEMRAGQSGNETRVMNAVQYLRDAEATYQTS